MMTVQDVALAREFLLNFDLIFYQLVDRGLIERQDGGGRLSKALQDERRLKST